MHIAYKRQTEQSREHLPLDLKEAAKNLYSEFCFILECLQLMAMI